MSPAGAVSPAGIASFEALDAAFDARFARAVERLGTVRRTIRLAGQDIRLDFAGAGLVEALWPAIRHSATPEGEDADPALTVRLWDSAGSGVDAVGPDWSRLALGRRGLLEEVSDAGRRVLFDWGTRGVMLHDRRAGRAQYWVPDAAQLPFWERSFPFRQLLAWHFADRGAAPVHAAALAVGGRGVLLPAPSGSGKSTTSLLSALAGLGFLGDDYVLIEAGAVPRVHALYRTAKLDDRSLALLPGLAPHARRFRPEDEKSVILWPPDTPGAGPLLGEAPLAAIIVPEIAEGETRIAPASPSHAVMALVPSTAAHLDTDTPALMRIAAELARRLPVFRLALGRDLERIPEVIANAVR